MTATLKGVVKNRRLELNVPDDWAEGMCVEVSPLNPSTTGDIYHNDDKLPDEEIARILALMDNFEPVVMTEAELAAWDAESEAEKAKQKADFNQYNERLARMWE